MFTPVWKVQTVNRQDSHAATHYGTKKHDFGMTTSFAVLTVLLHPGRKEGRDINTKPCYCIFIFTDCEIHSDSMCCAPQSLGHF